jgi:dynein heavy chain
MLRLSKSSWSRCFDLTLTHTSNGQAREGQLTLASRELARVLVLQTHYQLDSTTRLMCLAAPTVSDPEWQRSLRFYTQPMPGRASRHRSLCHARMMDYAVDHDFEYRVPGRLVMTPLTERCHLATFHAFKTHLASVFVGPASCGKTEIAKVRHSSK